MRGSYAILVVVAAACGEPLSQPPDGGRDAEIDASAADASSGGDASADAPARDAQPTWDGEMLPDVRWTLPACAIQRGVVDRYIEGPEAPSGTGVQVSADGGRVVIAYQSQLLELTASGAEPMDVAVPDSVVEWRTEWFAINRGQMRADVSYDTDEMSYFDRFLVVDGDRVELVPQSDLGFIERHDVPSHVSEDGSWELLGKLRDPDAASGLYKIQVDERLDIVDAVNLSDTVVQRVDRPRARVVRGATGSMLVRNVQHPDPFNSDETVEMIPFDETSAEPAAVVDDPLFLDGTRIDYLRAAADGDVVVILYRFGSTHGGYHQRVVEVSLDTTEVVREPAYLGGEPPEGGPGAISRDIELLTSPAGGIDVVQQPVSFGVSREERESSSLPLHIYPGTGRPLRLTEHEPLRLGAGAYVSGYTARRDGDRIVIVWYERGPSTDEDDPEERRTAVGVYWAVLKCDS